jgi:hypothetical protein
LRQHRGANEVVGEQLRHAVAEFVADGGPGGRDLEVANVVRHETGTRAEDGEVAATLAFISLSWLVSMDSRSSSSLIFRSAALGHAGRVLDAGDLRVAPGFSSALGAVV